MSATAGAIETGNELDQLKTRLKATWMTGDYGHFDDYMEKDAEEFFSRLPVKPGTRLLDVGCGAGQVSIIAARAGAIVTGCDIATNWLDQAQERSAAEGLAITFDEGDAEALPYPDASFDAVVSRIAAMFAPRPELVAAQLIRVCRPGGLIAMANWTPDGFIGQMFKTIAKHIAPSGMPSPVLWGDETIVRRRLQPGIADLKIECRMCRFEYPFPPADVVDFFRAHYGPMSRAFASLDAKGQQQLRSELIQLWSGHNTADGDTTCVDGEYLEVIATRAAQIQSGKNSRAAALATRIEQGAAALAEFAAALSDSEWSAPVPGNGSDRRPVGVIVDHVASVYPIEIQLAQAIAAGKPVTDVTWDVVAALNASHAEQNAGASKAHTLELLRRNSRAAADAVRAFTSEQLDRAAPFSLSFGAPVTAQFVIEDHALRHSWHHLARMRAALGR